MLVDHSYGKCRVRLVRVLRQTDRHDLKDLRVDIALEGDFARAYTDGDNSTTLPTDTMKNTVYALAKRHPAAAAEDFALLLGRHFVESVPHVTAARIDIAEQLWSRLSWCSFVKGGAEGRTTSVRVARDAATVESGIEDLVVLKTTGSGFEGFLQDAYTTLRPTADRVLATAVRAVWRYRNPEAPWNAVWSGVRQTILDAFVRDYSPSVQSTLNTMGEAVLEAFPDIAEIALWLPNKHCLLVDLAPFGLDNPNEVFVPVDEPHGLIHGRFAR